MRLSIHKEKSVECQTDDGLVAANHLRELLVALEASGAAPEAGKVWRDGNDGHGVDAASAAFCAQHVNGQVGDGANSNDADTPIALLHFGELIPQRQLNLSFGHMCYSSDNRATCITVSRGEFVRWIIMTPAAGLPCGGSAPATPENVHEDDGARCIQSSLVSVCVAAVVRAPERLDGDRQTMPHRRASMLPVRINR